jgi:tripartite-type tricarboxylate transporter receptor subunit TctC
MHSRGAGAIVLASVTASVTASLTWLARPAIAETYPTRAIRLIVPYAPGGSTDVVGRIVGQRLSEAVGQPVVVENRPGGMENIGVRACIDATPDGYTLCLPTQLSIVYNGLTMRQMSFNPSRDLVPIINLYSSMSVVAINSEYRISSIGELVRLAKTRRGALSYGTFAYPLESFIEKLNKENAIDIVKVPFRSGTELANAMLANSTPIGALGVVNIVSYLESGRVTGLAVNSNERMALFPDIPTLNELRPGEQYPPSWFGFFAPAGTPREIVEKIADVTGKILATPGFGDKSFGPAGQKLDDFRKFIAQDRAIAQRIVKDLGAEPQ